MSEVAPTETAPVTEAPAAAPAAEPAPAAVTSSDEAALAIFAAGMADPEAEPAPETPAVAPVVEAAPVVEPAAEPEPAAVDPIVALEQQRTEYLAAQAEEQRTQAAGEQKTAAQAEHEKLAAALQADAALMQSDPYAFADKHGIDKRKMLDALVKAGANPEAHAVQGKTSTQFQTIEAKYAALEAKFEAMQQGNAEQQQNAVRTQQVGEYNTIVTETPDAYPFSAKAEPALRVAIADEMADRYRGILLKDPEPMKKLAVVVEHELRKRVGMYTSLAGQASAPDTPDTSGSSAPTQGTTPAAVTLTNALAGEPPGTAPAPTTDLERDEKALRDFEAGLAG